MKYLILFFTVFLYSNDNFNASFITKYEYGKMLYKNPRGISCKKCHGDDAQGKNIVQFKHIAKNGIEYTCIVKSPNITQISKDRFKLAFESKKKKKKKKIPKGDVCRKLIDNNIMPKYFLTDEELDSIYYYLSNIHDYQ